nr:TlpA disulfide reductase family protein [Pseudoflavitalea sp. G-6-1-2]
MSVRSGSLPLSLQEELYGLFKDRVKQSSYGKSTLELIEARKYSAIGQTAYGFTMNNELGKAVEFASFRGKYVLIDFWASWCGPCVASFPKLKEVYEQYKNKGFEIVGVSTDKSEAAWQTAVKKYLNPWPQLHDTQNIAGKFFAVKMLPTTYLIHPDGKIVARDVHAEELGAKLSELLKQ